ncbi:MAG: hypothetical protein JW703_01150 [Candidatus Diapherotrites archaeon]|nr:hypothetical protein [Candidatus Diapherotrites archaeon]
MNKKGINFSIEFGIALIIAVLILSLAPQIKETSFETITLSAQEKDLLTVWAKEKEKSLNEMLSDAEFILGKRKIIIELNGTIIENNYSETKEKSAKEINYYDKNYRKMNLKLIVFH